MAEKTSTKESDLGRSYRSIVAISPSSLDLRPYQIHTREDGSREVEVVNEADDDDPSHGSPALLVTTSSSSSLLSSYMEQATKLATVEKENSDLTKANKGLLNENKRLKEEKKGLHDRIGELEQKVIELEARLAATEQGQNESDQELTYDELQRMNTVKEDSDVSSIDEMTGQVPTLAELQNMNPVRD